MKSYLLSFLTLATASSLVAQDGAVDPVAPTPTVNPGQATSRKIEMLPNQKAAIVMREEERNPFARRAPSEEEIEVVADENSQESRIRRIFESLPVSGVSRSGSDSGLRALVGDMYLEEGDIVPQMLADQTEFLVVTEVAEGEITLEWINLDTNELTGKEMTIGFDLETRVRSAIAGQRIEPDSAPVLFERKVQKERRREALVQAERLQAEPIAEEAREDSEEAQPAGATVLNGLDREIYLKGQ